MREDNKIVLSLPYAYIHREESLLVSAHTMYPVWRGNLPDIVGMGIWYTSGIAYVLTKEGEWLNLGYRGNKCCVIRGEKFPYIKAVSNQVVITVNPHSVWYTPQGEKRICCAYYSYSSGWSEKECVDTNSELIP